MDNIRDIINEIVKKQIPVVSIPARVTAVDESKGLIDAEPLDGSAELLDISINAEQDDSAGIVAVPAVDSVVLITMIDKNRGFVSLSSVVDKVFIKIKDISLEVDEDNIKLDGDGDGGLTITPTLRTELNKTTARITALEVALAAFAGAQVSAASAVPLFAPLIPAWSALTGAVAALPPQGLYNTNIESDTVKQG